MSDRTWPCPERARARIQAIMDSANREIGGVVAGVKLALDIPDAAGLDLERGVFLIPPAEVPAAGNGHQPNRAERRRVAARSLPREASPKGDEGGKLATEGGQLPLPDTGD